MLLIQFFIKENNTTIIKVESNATSPVLLYPTPGLKCHFRRVNILYDKYGSWLRL